MKRLTILAAATLILAACSGSAPEAREAVSIQADVLTLEPQRLTELREAPGSIRAGDSADLSARTVGNVSAIHVSEGQAVRKGQLLLTIDVRELDAQARIAGAAGQEVESAIAGAQAGAEAAKARYDLSQSTWNRYSVLRERNSVSPQEFEQVDADLRMAKAELERAQRGLDQVRSRRVQASAEVSAAQTVAGFGRILAPFDGIVVRRYVDVGSQAAPGMPLIRVDGGTGFRLDAALDETLGDAVSVGNTVPVRIDALDLMVEGRVLDVVPAIEPSTRTFTVKIALPEVPGLRAGLSGRALIPAGDRQGILVPAAAVKRQGQIENVWVVDTNGKTALRLVRTVAHPDGSVEVLSGLQSGERIAVSNVTRIEAGMVLEGGRS
ncbi:MAG: efflux RND transporter periplasmic adaptor subunit [Thermoanaerobaculia bacterium]